MEDEFYASVKLVSGEEIFGEVMPSEGIIIIPMDRVITVVEAQEDSEVVAYYQRFIMTNLAGGSSEKIKVTKKMGYVISVEKARETLEKIYKKPQSDIDS